MADIEFDTSLQLEGMEKGLKQAEKRVESLQKRLKQLQDDYDLYSQKAQEARAAGAYDEAETWGRKALNVDTQMIKVKNDLAIAEQNAADSAELVAQAEEQAAAGSKGTTAEAEAQAEAIERMRNSGEGLDKTLAGIGKRIKNLAKRVLFFSVVTKMLNGVKNKFSEIAVKNSEMSAAVSNLKGAFNTLITPLVNAVIPALTQFVGWLTKVVTALAMLIAKITGKDFKALQGDAKKGAKGKGGKQNQFASFDTINQLGSNDSGTSAQSLNDLEAAYDISELTNDEFKKILEQVGLIGAGMLAWHYRKDIFDWLLDKFFPAGEDGIIDFDKGLKKLAGVIMIVAGAVLLVKGYLDAWQNGIDWDNFALILGGLILLVGGIALAVSPVAAGFAAIGAGIALVVLGVKDMLQNGPNLQNTLTVIIGTISIIIGLLMSGHSILALVVAIIAAVIAIAATAGGEGQNILQHLRDALDGFRQFFKNIFAGNIGEALEGLKKGFKGLGNFAIDIFEGLVKAGCKAVNALIRAINKIKFGPIPDWVPLIGGKTFGLNIPEIPTDWSLPRLAMGAVIPPNREFAAILGDQKSGTNIEAPLDTIVAAFKAAQSDTAVNIVFEGDLAALGRVLAPYISVGNRLNGQSFSKGAKSW